MAGTLHHTTQWPLLKATKLITNNPTIKPTPASMTTQRPTLNPTNSPTPQPLRHSTTLHPTTE